MAKRLVAKGYEGLTAKQQRFVDEYLAELDFNATQAAIRAGYSKKTARQQAHRLLTNVDIQAALQERIAARRERVEVTQDRVLAELAHIAFSAISQVLTWEEDGSFELTPSERLGEGARAAIRKVKLHGGDVVGVELHDKVKALHLLAAHLGIATDRYGFELPLPALIERGILAAEDVKRIADGEAPTKVIHEALER